MYEYIVQYTGQRISQKCRKRTKGKINHLREERGEVRGEGTRARSFSWGKGPESVVLVGVRDQSP